MTNRKMARMMMAAGSAAVLFAAGSARAVEPVDGATASARQEALQDARGGEPSYPARTTSMGDPADAGRSGFVTHEELRKHDEALYARLEREQNARVTTPTFTDAG